MRGQSPNTVAHRALSSLVIAVTWLSAIGDYPIFGQSAAATLVGTVLDPSGAFVPAATLSVTGIGTNITRSVMSNERGDFTIPGLAPGTYRLVGEHAGFKRTLIENVQLLVNQTARVDIVLEVGAVTESVAVTGAMPLV